MRRIKYLILCFVWLSGFAQGQGVRTLSESSEISIITMGPYYEELYAAFGHSAIRVFDPVNNIDFAYNYGTFDFDQPNFYLNFARGNLLYKLSVQDYQRLKQIYIYYNRFIHEQILDLNQDQKQRVFNFLQNNALPENASYNYDYFYDNCATRIRDVFVMTLGYSMRFDNTHITEEKSIRDLTDEYLIGNYPWGDLGIDLCLGLPMDKIMAPSEYMFIPDYVEAAFDNAWLKTSNGEKPIIKRKEIIFQPEFVDSKSSLITPSVVFLLGLIITAFVTRRHMQKVRKGRYFDAGLFILVGLIGIFLTLLWFATDHKAAAINMNIIWAFPFHFLAGLALLFSKKDISAVWGKYFRIVAIVMVVLLLTWPILPQMMPTSLMFISAAIGVRAAYIGWGKAYNTYNSARE